MPRPRAEPATGAPPRGAVLSQPIRGVFATPPTPFTDDDEVDVASLQRAVDFCLARGAYGIVAPVNASEGPSLTDTERRRVVEVIVEQTARWAAVVIGVSGVSTRATPKPSAPTR